MTSSSVLAGLMLVASAHAGVPQLFEAVEPHMGTLVSIRVYAGGEEQAKAAYGLGDDQLIGPRASRPAS